MRNGYQSSFFVALKRFESILETLKFCLQLELNITQRQSLVMRVAWIILLITFVGLQQMHEGKSCNGSGTGSGIGSGTGVTRTSSQSDVSGVVDTRNQQASSNRTFDNVEVLIPK